jgi:hypothetical protein
MRRVALVIDRLMDLTDRFPLDDGESGIGRVRLCNSNNLAIPLCASK